MICDWCHGMGYYLDHSPTCDDDLCVLNGDQHSCAGQLSPCMCPAGRHYELTGALRRCPWLAHPGSQRRHFSDQRPIRRRRGFRWRERRPRRRLSNRQVLASLLSTLVYEEWL